MGAPTSPQRAVHLWPAAAAVLLAVLVLALTAPDPDDGSHAVVPPDNAPSAPSFRASPRPGPVTPGPELVHR